MFTKNAYLRFFCFKNPINSGSAEQFYYNFTNVSGNKLPKHSGHGTENGGLTGLASVDVLYTAMMTHPKKGKSELYSDKTLSSQINIYGVVFGNGTDAESIDAYTMSGELFTTYNHVQSYTLDYDANGITLTFIYTLTNTGSEDFTISEVGMIDTACIKSTGKSYYLNNYLLERTLLETPITIPANNGVGQITYSIHMDYIDMFKGTIVS